VLLGVVVALCVGAPIQEASPALAADGTATWVSAPALPPPTPSGAQPSPYPVPVGHVGDIEFWRPNRGVLITAGNTIVPEGLYAYNGANWHLLSTVCGGTDGRIAWAGPDEFWTISDQRPGQVLPLGGTVALEDVSLCHFLDGQVVASYALPLDEPNSYQQMDSAACDSASDCWFGGALDSAGAFHLHWNGTAVTEVDTPQDHQIASMTVDNDQIFESVQIDPGDDFATEDPNAPPLFHVIVPSDAADPFHSMFPDDDQNPACGSFCPPLPEYGTNAPSTLGGFSLSSDWRAGATDPQLWAAAGARPGVTTGNPIVLRYADGNWTQVVPNLVSLPGDDTPVVGQGVSPSAQIVAAEPNESAAWIGVLSPSNPDGNARVVRVAVDGTNSATVTDQDELGTPQGVGPRGDASAISCPAAEDCWLATTTGWLFHLTNGTKLPVDTDPNFAGVITFRPADGGVPSVIPEEETTVAPPPPVVVTQPAPKVKRKIIRKKAKPLVKDVKSRLVGRTVLELSIKLTATAHVRLLAKRHGVVVAETRRSLLRPGRHILRLTLNPNRWPTALKLQAVPLGGHGGGGGRSRGGGPTVISS
jgi:hypothetical protein